MHACPMHCLRSIYEVRTTFSRVLGAFLQGKDVSGPRFPRSRGQTSSVTLSSAPPCTASTSTLTVCVHFSLGACLETVTRTMIRASLSGRRTCGVAVHKVDQLHSQSLASGGDYRLARLAARAHTLWPRMDVARGLMAIHKHGVQHNCVHPQHVVVQNGSPRIVSFERAEAHAGRCAADIYEGARPPSWNDFRCRELYQYACDACV